MTVEQFRALHAFTAEFDILQQSLWVAPLQNQRNRMVEFSRDNTDHVFSSELYMNKDNPVGTYARINFKWNNSATPVSTAVIGPKGVIQRYAMHDHKLMLPVSKKGIENISGATILPLNDLSTLMVIRALQMNEMWYYVRLSSFVCTKVELREFQGSQLKVILLERVIDAQKPHEFFAHIHEAHEDNAPCLDEKNGFIVSNSQTYISNHPELQFEEFPQLYNQKNQHPLQIYIDL